VIDVAVQELYDDIEKHRTSMVENLVKKYRTIPQLLGKMEEVVAGTNSGKSQQMAAYYSYWERCIFNALNEMALNGMAALYEMMQKRSCTRQDTTGNARIEAIPLPLFQVWTSRCEHQAASETVNSL
jgi:hypothetical protein